MSFNFVLLAISITFSTDASGLASSPFLLECRVPNNSSLNQSVNAENFTQEEIERLELEGRCFLACATQENYSTEVNLIMLMMMRVRSSLSHTANPLTLITTLYLASSVSQ